MNQKKAGLKDCNPQHTLHGRRVQNRPHETCSLEPQCITSLECKQIQIFYQRTAPQTKLRQVDGKWPTHGYDGRPLPDYPEKGMWLAGGWRAVLDGFQGDADWFHKLFHYKRPSTLSHEIFFVTNL